MIDLFKLLETTGEAIEAFKQLKALLSQNEFKLKKKDESQQYHLIKFFQKTCGQASQYN